MSCPGRAAAGIPPPRAPRGRRASRVSEIASSILQRSRKGGGAEDGEVQAEARAVDIGEVQAEGVKHNAAT